MTHKMQRRYLIEELLKENRQYSGRKIPTDENEQKALLRALMNVRLPKAVPPRFLEIQDAYLQEEIPRGAIVDADSLPPVPRDCRIALW